MSRNGLIASFFIIVLCFFAFFFTSDISLGFRESKSTEISIQYPFDKTIFPPEIIPPTFMWNDSETDSDLWTIDIAFKENKKKIQSTTDSTKWNPDPAIWETIKNLSKETDATVTIRGKYKSIAKTLFSLNKVLSKNSITISTSIDSVGAPIFYRDVSLPFNLSREFMETIEWRMGDISKEERPPVIMKDMPVCANCHSFSLDGSTLGMDVDSGGDKGSYAVTPVEENIFLTPDQLLTWTDYKREDEEPTFGLLAQISPDAKYVAAAVKDRVVFITRSDLYFSQLFFPVKGIIAIYDNEKKQISPLPGADDMDFVQANPVWSPDGKYIIFARMPITDFMKNDKTKGVVLTPPQTADILGGKQYIDNSNGAIRYLFNLYRIPFNDGKGGTPEPILGASFNDRSNYFPKYSPDGKWIIFCQADSYMVLQPTSKLYIMPADLSEEPREMNYNFGIMNSWHSWSPNSKWLVFSSKEFSPFTDLFLKHIDENGNDSPPVLLSQFHADDRARNIPEFVNIPQRGIQSMDETFVDYYSYNRKGYALLQLRKYEQAEKAFLKSITLNPDYAESRGQYGMLLAKTGRDVEAEVQLKVALEMNPDDAMSLTNLGLIHVNRKEFDLAKSFFDKSIKIDPNFAQTHDGYGAILMANGDLEAAQKKYEQALELNRELYDTHYRLGTLYIRKNEYDKAREHFEFILTYVNDSRANMGLGTIHFINNEFDEAEKQFKITLNADPINFEALRQLAIIYMERENFSDAEVLLRNAMKLKPGDSRLYFMLGTVLSEEARTLPEAIKMYNEGLSIAPGNAQAHINLGNIYARQRNREQALFHMEAALKINPNDRELRKIVEQLKR